MTVLDHLLSVFREAGIYNRHDLARPTVILWTDGERHWGKVAPLIARARPGFFQLVPSENDDFRGPSTWIRYQLGKWSGDELPVVYLPGIHRHQFRGAAGFPEAAKHLYALQFQGQFCSQLNNKDWTPTALLSSNDGGLGLKVSRDRVTQEALAEQLPVVLTTPVASLRGRHLESSDFHEFAAGDPVRLVLDWMSDSETASKNWPSGQRAALVNYSKKELGFDPHKDGLITAAEKLVAAEGKWERIWKRFEEAATSFPGIRKALDLVQPTDLFSNSNPRIPAVNRRMEDELRMGLISLGSLNSSAASGSLAELAADHADRCDGIWARHDEAPLAVATSHLGKMLDAMKRGVSGADCQTLGDSYLVAGWKVDAEAWKAWSAIRKSEDSAAIGAALKAVYQPWLEELAERLQGYASNYPTSKPVDASEHAPRNGTVILFVDGLRSDVARELAAELVVSGLHAETRLVWSALPTVTATSKPAWRPLADHLSGQQASGNYEPTINSTGKLCRTSEFRKLTTDSGWQWFEASQIGDPSGSGWTEAGAFDRYGHEQGAKLAWRIREEIAVIHQRIDELLSAGWQAVRVVTDHGWLWLPGGLPKVDLPKHLTVSKWGRCARPEPEAAHSFRQVPWFWGNEHSVVLAPGISVFQKGVEYAHGGLTLQEALTLSIEISAGEPVTEETVRVLSVKWVGLRLRCEVSSADGSLRADIRTKAGDPTSTIFASDDTQQETAPDSQGRLTLIVEDDTKIGQAAILVILRSGQVIAKQNITIGED